MTRHHRSSSPAVGAGPARAAALGALASALLGCTGVTAPVQAGASSPGASGLDAFRSGLYAFATPTTSCGLCHASLQVPLFASGDVGAAYTAAKALVDFAQPTNSLFIVYAGNNHCGLASVCGPGSGSPAIVQEDLIRWAGAETASGPGGPPATGLAYRTASLPIPDISTLPTLTSGKTALLRFELSGLQPLVAALSGAVLELELVMPNPTEYRFTSPKVAGSAAALQLTGLHVLVKPAAASGLGAEDTNQGDTWDAITVTIPVSTLPSPLPATPLAVTPLDSRAIAVGAYTSGGDRNDTITVGFDALR